jgi:hypothetical protein
MKRPLSLRVPQLGASVMFVAALARSAAADPVVAEALFEDGRRLMLEGRHREACPKLAESHVQDPASGTLLNLALCRETLGELAQAWVDYRAAATLARRDGKPERAAEAERKAESLLPRVPTITVQVEAAPPGLFVMWRNVRIGAAVLGTAFPIDPGRGELTAGAPGFRTWSKQVDVPEGRHITLHVPQLQPLAPPEPRSPRPHVAGPHRQRQVGRADTQSWTRSLPVGVGIAVVSAASLGAGAWFGIESTDAYDEAERLCPSHAGCNSDAMAARRTAESNAWAANVAFGVGLLTGLAGTWIIIRGTRSDQPSVRAKVGAAHGVVELASPF